VVRNLGLRTAVQNRRQKIINHQQRGFSCVQGGLTFWKFDKNSTDWYCSNFVWEAKPTKTARGDETVRFWNHNWELLCHWVWGLWAVSGFRLYGLPWELVLQHEDKKSNSTEQACWTDSLIDFSTSLENLTVTKSFTPNCLAPCTMNKPTAFSAYSSTSRGTRGLSQGAEI